MIDRYEVRRIDEEIHEDYELANWAWNSHWWVEYAPGYCRCKWCKALHTSEQGINKDFPLCNENPAIKKFLKEGGYVKG